MGSHESGSPLGDKFILKSPTAPSATADRYSSPTKRAIRLGGSLPEITVPLPEVVGYEDAAQVLLAWAARVRFILSVRTDLLRLAQDRAERKDTDAHDRADQRVQAR